MDNITKGTTPSNSGLSSNLHTGFNSLVGAAEDVANKAKPAIDQAAAVANNVVDKAVDATGSTAEWLTEKGESLNAASKKLLSNTGTYISANPFKALGLVVAAGYLLSLAIKKVSSSN